MQRALDVLVYAPAGYVLQTTEDFPAMVAKGRDRLEVHVENARVVGMFVVTKTRSDLARQLERTQSLGGRQARPDQGEAPSPRPTEPAEAMATDEAPAGVPRPQVPSARPPGPASRGAGATGDAPTRLRSLPSDRAGTAAADAAIEGYDTLSASQVVRRLDGLGADELTAVYRHESATRGRRTILHRVQQLLGTAGVPPPDSGAGSRPDPV